MLERPRRETESWRAAEPPPIALRAATRADSDFVAALADEAFGHLGNYRRILAGWFAHAGVHTEIAQCGDALLGFVMFAFIRADEDQPPIADIVAIAVHPAERRRGLGRRLLATALTRISHAAPLVGASRVGLSVAADNVAARALFESAGFRHLAAGDGRYPNGQPYLRLARALVAPQDAQRRTA
ncbi:MAG: GNAT family N-acetyltransferase [Myxococcales bacterium]|nr:GNAT family N-acetyltransferase [Myxococcales bacterium]